MKAMINCKRFLIAEHVTRDADTKTVSVTSIVDELAISEVPGVIYKLALYFVIGRTEDEPQQIEVEVTAQLNSHPLPTKSILINFDGKVRCDTILNAYGIPVKEVGNLTFSIQYQNKILSEYVLGIIHTALNPKTTIHGEGV